MQPFLARTGFLTAVLFRARCQQQFSADNSSEGIVGYMYTSLNGEGENKVILFARAADGSLLYQSAFGTGSDGGADRSAGGAALGDFDGQEAIQIIEDSLLVVNAGGNTITVFELNRATGGLAFVENDASQGIRPVSIAVTAKEEEGQYWVVVGNQWGNPNVQFGGPEGRSIQFFPDKQFITCGRKALDRNRNIFLFSFDARTQVLTPERRIDAYVGTNGGPTCVAFSPDGAKLAVATWGIAHLFASPGQFQQPSRVYVYDFCKRSGSTSDRRFFEEQGVAGSIGFNWSPHGGRDLLYVSNFNLAEERLHSGVTVLDASPRSWRWYRNQRRIPKVQNFGTGTPGAIVEDCWTFISRDGGLLWVAGFAANIVSTFRIDPFSGLLSIVGPGSLTDFVQRPNTPTGDTKDLWQSPDGRFLYCLGAFETFEVARFDIAGASLTLVNETVVQAAKPRQRGAFNFLGLVGFDL